MRAENGDGTASGGDDVEFLAGELGHFGAIADQGAPRAELGHQ